MATNGYVALFGEFSSERGILNTVAQGFGWSTCQVACSSGTEPVGMLTPLVAVLIYPLTLGLPWKEALDLIKAVAPEVRVVICHGVEELDSQSEMTASGAFYSLLMPPDPREVQFMFEQLIACRTGTSEQEPNRSVVRARAV